MKLHSIEMPPSEFDHVDKGDALYGEFVFNPWACDFIGVVFH